MRILTLNYHVGDGRDFSDANCQLSSGMEWTGSFVHRLAVEASVPNISFMNASEFGGLPRNAYINYN